MFRMGQLSRFEKYLVFSLSRMEVWFEGKFAISVELLDNWLDNKEKRNSRILVIFFGHQAHNLL